MKNIKYAKMVIFIFFVLLVAVSCKARNDIYGHWTASYPQNAADMKIQLQFNEDGTYKRYWPGFGGDVINEIGQFEILDHKKVSVSQSKLEQVFASAGKIIEVDSYKVHFRYKFEERTEEERFDYLYLYKGKLLINYNAAESEKNEAEYRSVIRAGNPWDTYK